MNTSSANVLLYRSRTGIPTTFNFSPMSMSSTSSSKNQTLKGSTTKTQVCLKIAIYLLKII